MSGVFLCYLPLVFETVYLIEPRAHYFDGSDWRMTPQDLLVSTHFTKTEIQLHAVTSGVNVGAGIWTQVLMFAQQALYPLSLLQSL